MGIKMKIICVDDEKLVLENFALKTKDMLEVDGLEVFEDPNKALDWVENNQIDVAFLDIEMPQMDGIELAKRLKQIDENIRVIYMTAYEQYALDAFRVDAIGYILKPYDKEDINHELQKAIRMKAKPKKKVKIQTMPSFSVLVDGEALRFDRAKPEELLALLVDRAEIGVTAGDAIACLWPERMADESTQTLYRVTFHRLMEILKKAGVEFIIGSEGRKRYIVTEQIECDLYQLLAGNKQVLRQYSGEYLRQYSWAEFRNAQINNFKMK